MTIDNHLTDEELKEIKDAVSVESVYSIYRQRWETNVLRLLKEHRLLKRLMVRIMKKACKEGGKS